MPQILFLIIALIVKLAIEGGKELNKTSSSSKSSSYKRSKYRADGGPSRTSSLTDLHEKQSTTIKTYKKSNAPIELEKDTYDTKDYEDFTNTEIEEINNQEEFVESTIKTATTYEMRANKIKFMIYSLVYCMHEDDNEFTRKEKRMFKMITRVASMNLNNKDTEEIKAFVDIRPRLDDIVRLQRKYNLDINDVIETLGSLRKHLKGSDQYRPVIERIEKRFQYEL